MSIVQTGHSKLFYSRSQFGQPHIRGFALKCVTKQPALALIPHRKTWLSLHNHKTSHASEISSRRYLHITSFKTCSSTLTSATSNFGRYNSSPTRLRHFQMQRHKFFYSAQVVGILLRLRSLLCLLQCKRDTLLLKPSRQHARLLSENVAEFCTNVLTSNEIVRRGPITTLQAKKLKFIIERDIAVMTYYEIGANSARDRTPNACGNSSHTHSLKRSRQMEDYQPSRRPSS